MTPFEEFVHRESTSSILLLVCTALAIGLANSGWNEFYQHLIHTDIAILFNSTGINKSAQHWINDGLMALFFFVVGLEIKREVLVGALADRRQAVLPITAAVGGMVVPVIVYVVIAFNSGALHGWAIPMATDIAFAMGVLVLLGDRIPRSVLSFLLALAIVDDLGAVIVIAIFYTSTINWDYVTASAVLITTLVLLNMFGVRRPWPYVLVGLGLWLAMLKSGIHATLAGVITALCVPGRPRYDPERFSEHVRTLMDRYEASFRTTPSINRNQEMRSILQTIENGLQGVRTPVNRLELSLHAPVAFIIIPLFAFVNAGVLIDVDQLGAILTQPVTLGVAFGLVLGKLVGIVGFCWLALRYGVGRLPPGMTLSHIVGVGLLAGIGFTMSIFITELSFENPINIIHAKTGIIVASLCAGVAGYVWLRLVPQSTRLGSNP